MKTFISFFSLLLLTATITIFSGCDDKRPAGMPKLERVKLTVTQEGKPCDDAKLGLLPIAGDPQWSSGGTTNSNGILEPVTYGKYKGMPAGKYKVTVDRSVGVGDPPPPSPIDAESQKKHDEYYAAGKSYELFQTIPTEYRLRDQSPLEIEIKPGTNELTIDIPETVQEKIQSSAMR